LLSSQQTQAATIGDADAVRQLLAAAAARAPPGRNEEERAQYAAEAVKDFVNNQ
jgi:hypothetical protein